MTGMSTWDLFTTNIGSPAVLAFMLGMVAAALRSDLRFPEPVTSLLSTYLLFAIGLKGGVQLRDAGVDELFLPALATLALGIATPFIAYVAARRWARLDIPNAASIAAHFGSVSAVTFTAAESFAKAAGTLTEGYLPALVALLEVPGIVIALAIAARARGTGSTREAVHEVLAGKSVVLLVGGVVIGLVATPSAVTKVDPLFVALFPGVLCLFLLDLGTLAGQRLGTLRRQGARLLSLAVVLPLLFGSAGVMVGHLAGLSVGGVTVLAAMAASASYIAAPAAVRVGLPEADLGMSLGLALGLTFPFNLTVGIPLYNELAKLLG